MSSGLSVDKRVKTQGKCVGCQEKFTPVKGKTHLFKCTNVLQLLRSEADLEEGYLVRVSCAYSPNIYWMLTAVPQSLQLVDLDEFLRDIWLECCGHLSVFMIGGRDYLSFTESREPSSAFEKKVGQVISPGLKFKYKYDMGSTTDLVLQVLETFESCPKEKVTLLMQNDPPPIPCEICEKPADIICSICQETTCNDCIKQHSCAEEDMMLPLVNSPRTGICGYDG